MTKKLPYQSVLGTITYLVFPIIQIFQILNPNKYKLGELLFVYISLFSKLTLTLMAYYEGTKSNKIVLNFKRINR